MKTKFSNSEICHVWTRQNQESGKGSNIFFVKDKIYSYGHHFCMAKLLPAGVVLVTNRGYSVTTSKHLSYLHSAISHLDKVYCYKPDGSLNENLSHVRSEIASQINIIGNTRKRQQTKDRAFLEVRSIVDNTKKLFEAYGTTEKKALKEVERMYPGFIAHWDAANSLDFESLNTQLERAKKAEERREKKEQNKRIADAKERIDKWLNGHSDINIYSIGHLLGYVYLREKEGYIETSRGARVKLESGKILFKMIEAKRDIKGHVMDGYTVISINGVLKIGCHEIDTKEVYRFAKTQNWI